MVVDFTFQLGAPASRRHGLIAPPDGAASHLTLQVSGRTAVPVVTLCADSSVSRVGVPWLLRVVPQTTDEAKALFTGIPPIASSKTNRWLLLQAHEGKFISGPRAVPVRSAQPLQES